MGFVKNALHGLTGGMFKGPENINQNFAFGTPDSRTNEYSANPDLMASVSNLNNMGNQFNQQYGQMIDPNSSYNAGLYAQAGQGIQDAGAQRFQQQNQAIASTGGPASMATLLRAVGQSNDANSYAGAIRNIQNNSLQQAQGFGQMATGAYQQAGGFNAGIDTRALQNNMNNMQSENNYNQYLATSNYNQDMQNQNASMAHKNSMLSMVGGVGSALLGGGLGGGLASTAMSFFNRGQGSSGGGQGSSGGSLPASYTGGNFSLGNNSINTSRAQQANDYYLSDIRLKTDVKQTGQSPSGLNIYSFKYKGDDKTYEGVMAQDVPWATKKAPNGYYAVDYSKVDVDFRRVG